MHLVLLMEKKFSSGTFQDYFVFIPAKKYIENFSATARIDSWKSNEIAEENIKSITKSESNYASTFADHYSLPDVNFNSHYLIKDNISIPKK